MEQVFLDQSAAQIAAAGGRQVVWVFAEASTAEYATQLFATARGGRDKIGIVTIPWLRSGPRRNSFVTACAPIGRIVQRLQPPSVVELYTGGGYVSIVAFVRAN